MSGLPIVNFYALRIGASNVDGVGDFIDNQIPGLCVFVAECGDDCSITIVNIPNVGNFVYEDELFGIIASEISQGTRMILMDLSMLICLMRIKHLMLIVLTMYQRIRLAIS
jgi:hypothetical protein